jgi:glutathione synthase/RimK-type ligase-like ATP-grasp enzyme
MTADHSRPIAFLTMDDLSDFYTYDELLIDPLSKKGWAVDMVSWRDSTVDWDDYEAVIIRSPWDYQDDADAFFDVLRTIEESSARLANSLDIVKWNIRKTYLRDLEDQGIAIVPTLWPDKLEPAHLDQYFEEFETDQIILKPIVGANADHTYWLTQEDHSDPDVVKQLVQSFAHRPFMVQPFMPAIVEEGEYSLFYFADEYSHAILKIPEDQDFRVQEEHGGRLQAVGATEAMERISEQIMDALPESTLYARVDLVRDLRGYESQKPTPEPLPESFCVMEVELIEPSLYFNMDEHSAERFARIFTDWMQA